LHQHSRKLPELNQWSSSVFSQVGKELDQTKLSQQ
jgi:hypothetical protein